MKNFGILAVGIALQFASALPIAHAGQACSIEGQTLECDTLDGTINRGRSLGCSVSCDTGQNAVCRSGYCSQGGETTSDGQTTSYGDVINGWCHCVNN